MSGTDGAPPVPAWVAGSALVTGNAVCRHVVIGVDPGAAWTGITTLYAQGYWLAAGRGEEVIAENAFTAIHDAIMTESRIEETVVHVALERFRPRYGVTRRPGIVTTELIGRIVGELAPMVDVMARRDPVSVKAWASDKRLAAAGILARLRGMPHAQDAARHALYHAFHRGLLPDPLTSKWGRQ